eukprot:6144195-Prorocentrum_lima.AAC.1
MPPPPSPPGPGGTASSGANQQDWTCSNCGRDNWPTRYECRAPRGMAVSRSAARNKRTFGPPSSGKGNGRAGRPAPSGAGGSCAESEQLALQLANLKRLRA